MRELQAQSDHAETQANRLAEMNEHNGGTVPGENTAVRQTVLAPNPNSTQGPPPFAIQPNTDRIDMSAAQRDRILELEAELAKLKGKQQARPESSGGPAAATPPVTHCRGILCMH